MPKGEPQPGQAIFLSRWQRFGLTGSGAVLTATGGWAEIASGMDGAGTVAFVAAGVILGALGIIGRLPNRLSGKDYSVEFEAKVEERVQEEVAEIVEDLPATAKKEIAAAEDDSVIQLSEAMSPAYRAALANRLSKLSGSTRYVASSAAARSLDFEERVTSYLVEGLKARGAAIEVDAPHPDDKQVDAVLRISGRPLKLVIQARRIPADSWSQDYFANLQRTHGPDLLLITESGVAVLIGQHREGWWAYPDRHTMHSVAESILRALNG